MTNIWPDKQLCYFTLIIHQTELKVEKTRHHIQHDHQPDSASDKLWNPWSDNGHLSRGSYLVWALYHKYKFRHKDNQNVHTTTKKDTSGALQDIKNNEKCESWKTLLDICYATLQRVTVRKLTVVQTKSWSIMNILSAHTYLANGIKNETTPQLCSGSKTRNEWRNMGTESSQWPRHLKTRFKL